MSFSKTFHIVVRGITFVFGVFLLALCYNVLLYPNNLVTGGMSGLGIVFQTAFGWNATAFIYISSITLLIISYFLLGKETTSNSAVGAILYPIMVSITSPIANFILQRFDLTEFVVIVCLAGFFYGIANGIIYKMGYTTGGGDVIMQLASKYFKISSSRANLIYSFIIIFLSGLTFGLSSFIYSTIILLISNYMINKIIVGVSNSKVFFISTQKLKEIKDLIQNEYHSGLTILSTQSHFIHRKGEIVMVVIPNREYYSFKNRILEIDPEAFFIINDSYEVGGGKRNHNIPFMHE